MNAIPPASLSAIVAMGVSLLMVSAGVAKRLLAWRPLERRPPWRKKGRAG